MPTAADPRAEMRLASENLAKEIDRQKAAKASEARRAAAIQTQLADAAKLKRDIERDTSEVVGDIAREFKVQRNENKTKERDLQAEVAELTRRLEETNKEIEKTRNNYETQLRQKDEIIQRNITESEQMAQDFKNMLRDTLIKMSDRIELSRESDENQPVPESGALQ